MDRPGRRKKPCHKGQGAVWSVSATAVVSQPAPYRFSGGAYAAIPKRVRSASVKQSSGLVVVGKIGQVDFKGHGLSPIRGTGKG